MSNTVLYLCNRLACEYCSPLCNYTSNALYAKNFKFAKDGKTIIEKSYDGEETQWEECLRTNIT